MAMSKKDYEAIAQAIADCTNHSNKEDMMFVAKELADYMAKGNPLFSRVRFLDACLP